MRTFPKWFPFALVGLAGSLVVIAALGPLGSGAVRYRYSETMLNQARGLDAFAVAVVAPIALIAAYLSARRRRAAALVALAPAGFSAYMLAQYVVGPEYLRIDGNGERAFLLFVGAFVLSCAVLVQAWALAPTPASDHRAMRRRGAGLLALGGFVVAGMYLSNGFLSAMADFPSYVESRETTSEFGEHPTAYWLVAFLDLGIVVPLTVATGIGLLRGRAWAARAYYGVLGWYALVPASVAAMALIMVARNDPAANAPKAGVLTAVASALLYLAGRAFAPLLRGEAEAATRASSGTGAPLGARHRVPMRCGRGERRGRGAAPGGSDRAK